MMRLVSLKMAEVNPSKRARAMALIVAFTVSIAATLVGTIPSMSTSDAQGIVEEFEAEVPHLMSVSAIFRNNFMHCLLMFTPVLGPLYALYVLYSTGRVLAALGIVHGVNPATLFGFTFLFPFAWFEYVAYALAISQSVWIIVGIAQRRFKAEAIITGILIAACALLLLSAAAIEVALLLKYSYLYSR